MPINIVARTAMASPNGDHPTTPAINTTGATVLVMFVSSYFNPGNVADSKGNTWTPLALRKGGDFCARWWYCLNPTVGAGHTFSTSGDSLAPTVAAYALSGVDLAATPAEAGTGSAAATTLTMPATTPGTNGALILAGLNDSNAPVAATINGGFTLDASFQWVNGQHIGGSVASLLQATAAAVSPTWSWDASTQYAAGSLAIFAPASSGGSTPTLSISPTTAAAGSGTQTVSLTATRANSADAIAASVSGGGTLSTSAPASGAAFTWTKPGTGSGTATVTVAAGSLSATSTITYTADVATSTIPVTNANLFFSPYNWDSDGSGSPGANNVRALSTWVRTNNPGAYLKTAVQVGSAGNGSASLVIDAAGLQGVAPGYGPRLAITVDGGAATFATLAYSASPVVLPLATGLAAGWHSVRVDFQGVLTSGADGIDRWVTPAVAVKVTGLRLDAGSATAGPATYPDRMIVFGDSITEGEHAYGGGSNPGDQDSTATYARHLADALRCEYGIVGFGSQGYQSAGRGGVPALPSAWDKFSAGRSRLVAGALSPAPKYLLDDHGTNGATTSANVQAQIALYRAAAPTAAILKATPVGYLSASAILSGVAAYRAANPSDSGVYALDTAASLVAARTSGDGVHPNELGHALYACRLGLLIGLATASGGGGGAPGVYPDAGEVLDGVAFGPSGSSTTGTLQLPDAAEVLAGVGFGAGGTEFTGSLDPDDGGGGGGPGLTPQAVQAACAAAIAATPARLDLTQPLADVTTATVGGALHGAWANCWGKSTKDRVNRLLKVFGIGSQAVPAKVFALDNADNPTTKVPQ